MSATEMTPAAETVPTVSTAVAPTVHTATVTPLHAHTRVGALEPVRAPRFTAPAVKALVKPPAVWSEPRPSLAQLWEYGARGQYAGETGAWRKAGQAYAVFAWVVHLLGYLALWVVEHPARLVVALLVFSLVLLAF